MMQWDLYPALSAAMPVQMAFDEILFRSREAGELTSPNPILRFYFSSEPWVSIGYSHRMEAGDYPGQPVCKRLTGGGAVRHGQDIMFSLIARKQDDESFSQVRLSYLKIHEALKQAFESLGFRPEFYRCDENLPRGKDCFVFPIATDLALEGRKIAGGSQKRSSGVLLHQESVQLRKGLEWEVLMPAMIAAFEKRFEVNIRPAQMDPGLLGRAEKLAAEKYGQDWSELKETHGRVGQLS